MSEAALLIAARFVHYAALTSLFGGVLFARLGHANQAAAARSGRALFGAGLALISGIAWFFLVAGAMADVPILSLDRDTLSSALFDTSFGRLWMNPL